MATAVHLADGIFTPVSGYPAYHDPTTTVPPSPDFRRANSVTRFNVEEGEKGGKEVEYFFASDARLELFKDRENRTECATFSLREKKTFL